MLFPMSSDFVYPKIWHILSEQSLIIPKSFLSEDNIKYLNKFLSCNEWISKFKK
jgi:hypothetical protein